MPYASPRRLAMRVGDDTDSGGYEGVGIRFLVPGEMDTLSWKKKKGLWDTYDWHIGRLQGSAAKAWAQRLCRPGRCSRQDWQLEERGSGSFGPFDTGRKGTRDFASLKSRIFQASMGYGEKGEGYLLSRRIPPRLTHNPDFITEIGKIPVLYIMAAGKSKGPVIPWMGRTLVQPEGGIPAPAIFRHRLRLDRQL